MQINKNHFAIGEKRFLWRQVIQRSNANDEIFQETSLRVISLERKEKGNIFEKVEAKKKELLQNQAEHEELLEELAKQGGDTKKIAALVLREIKNNFLGNDANENCDENITRSTIKNLWNDLQKNLDAVQCKNLAKEVLRALQTATAQRDRDLNEDLFAENFAAEKNKKTSQGLQVIAQVFSEEADSAQLKKAKEDWQRQKKESRQDADKSEKKFLISDFFKKKSVWLLLFLFLIIIVCFFVAMNKKIDFKKIFFVERFFYSESLIETENF